MKVIRTYEVEIKNGGDVVHELLEMGLEQYITPLYDAITRQFDCADFHALRLVRIGGELHSKSTEGECEIEWMDDNDIVADVDEIVYGNGAPLDSGPVEWKCIEEDLQLD
jgi:hypothetical protein